MLELNLFIMAAFFGPSIYTTRRISALPPEAAKSADITNAELRCLILFSMLCYAFAMAISTGMIGRLEMVFMARFFAINTVVCCGALAFCLKHEGELPKLPRRLAKFFSSPVP